MAQYPFFVVSSSEGLDTFVEPTSGNPIPSRTIVESIRKTHCILTSDPLHYFRCEGGGCE